VTDAAIVKLADLVELVAGHAFKSERFTENASDVCLVKGENVGQGRILWDISKRWPAADVARFARFELRSGDVVVAMDRPWVPAGLKWAPIRVGDPPALLVQRVARLRSRSQLLRQGFLQCLIGSAAFENYVRPITSGVNVPHISGRQILDFAFRLPDLSAQDRIVGLISAFDDLIETNLRRVRILDDMSIAVYREWFIAPRAVDSSGRSLHPSGSSMPTGWSRSDLATVCAGKTGIQTGPFGSQLHQSDYADEGVPVVMPKDLVGFRIDTYGIARVPSSVAERLARHKTDPGDILYGRRGEIGRRAFVMPSQAGWLCGTGCLRLRPDPSRVNGWFLFNYLGEVDVVQLIAGRAHGVTLPNLNAGLMASVPVLLPPRSLQDRFEAVTFPMAQLIETLLNQNAVLRQTRDLLLPRLLSGQLRLTDLKDGLSARTPSSQVFAAI
jgi:type I restriction enzyme, S subunit